MPVVRYGEKLNVLVVAKGHPYLRDPFMAIFDEMEGVSASLVEQPAVQKLMNPDGMRGFDALVLYDMPGLDFRAADRPRFVEPDESLKSGLRTLLDAGTGVVALHHAIAGWPTWDEYAEWIGGRFLYRPAALRGKSRADSGYRHDVTHTISVATADHPVCAGVPANFKLTDELYLSEVFDDDVTPLLRSDYVFVRDNFYSATLAVAGEMFSNQGWSHDKGSNLVGWAKRARKSPLVYLQPGDGPATYTDANYRRLVANAIGWVASPAAKAWAKGD
ncbi:MAG TPA: ThuA domain-containing protein [Rhizomicrobium sp.]|nr:ThuA domain-containing protein [Rhizomicrobium sp.]